MAKVKKQLTDSEILERVNNTIRNYQTGYIEVGDLGYKFYPKKFIDVVYLYAHNVNTKTPDILGRTNKNTQRNPLQAIERKWQEQTSLDLKDLNFSVLGASSLARFIPKGANRKILSDNNFATTLDTVNDTAIRYGSSFLKSWIDSKDELKLKEIQPYNIIFDIYNFKKGLKIERFSRSVREIVEDETYNSSEREKLFKSTPSENLDQNIVLFQVVQDYPDETQSIYIVSTELEQVFYTYTTKDKNKLVSYDKNDFIKRDGFEDALGIGLYELVFNEMVQSKVNYERMDKVMDIASQLVFQKQIDNELDNNVGKNVTRLENGVILGYATNPISPMNMGGANQVTMIRNEINEIVNSLGPSLNMPDALLGETLPSGTSGILGNLLSENSASVLKDYQDDYANFLDRVYKDRIIPYMLEKINSDDDLKELLSPNDYKLVKRSVRNYLYVQKQIDAVLNDEEFDPVLAERQINEELKKSKIIPGELLDQLREEMDGISTYISGENISKPQVVAFLQDLQAKYMANPQILHDPFVRETLTKIAEYDAGMSVLEIESLFETLPELTQQPDVAETV